MELHEEYLKRRGVKAPCIKYVNQANLILKSKKPKTDYNWLQVTITGNGDTQHPVKYVFHLNANPSLAAEIGHFSPNSKPLKEFTWEWDQYEQGIIDFAKEYSREYTAITSASAIYIAWEQFIANYDAWCAHFLPTRIHDKIYSSLATDDESEKLKVIKEIETFLHSRFDKIFASWKAMKGNIEQKNYADWLAKVIN